MQYMAEREEKRDTSHSPPTLDHSDIFRIHVKYRGNIFMAQIQLFACFTEFVMVHAKRQLSVVF